MDDWLTPDDKRQLLQIARSAIARYLDGESFTDFGCSENLARPGAAFVTLMIGDRLRGCIGRIGGELPLAQTVAVCAVDAATVDPRFPPLRADELSRVQLEVSVLSPLEKISSQTEIEVGRDGLLIRLGAASGLLLPQVATEYGWDVTQFLQHTCEKAGLQRDAYLSPAAKIYRFEAIIIEETHRRAMASVERNHHQD